MIKVILIILFLYINAFSYALDDSSYKKIVKLVKKEEQISIAYKKYLKFEGKIASIDDLKKESKYLPSTFDETSYFGTSLKIENNKIITKIPKNLNARALAYYFSSSNRINSYSPNGKDNDVNIIFNEKEKFIMQNINKISKSKEASTYYLSKGVLNWYDKNTEYKYSLGDDYLIIAENVTVLDSLKVVSAEFTKLFKYKNILFAGQKIFQKKGNELLLYVYISPTNQLIVPPKNKTNIGKTLVQFTRRAGGIMINGDIYTWGNNEEKITGLNNNKFSGYKTNSYRKPVITTLLRLKAETNIKEIDDKGFYSSAFRPKFVDFFATVYHSTCGVSTKGELFCNSSRRNTSSYGEIQSTNGILKRSSFFNGVENKAHKIFGNNSIWHILANGQEDNEGKLKGGSIYVWGPDHSGFAGVSCTNSDYKGVCDGDDDELDDNYFEPRELKIYDDGIKVKFQDISYTLSIGERRIIALSDNGDLYIWGSEGMDKCTHKDSLNICEPNKIVSKYKFKTILGGQTSFIAQDINNNYFKIYQKYFNAPVITPIGQIIKDYRGEDDNFYVKNDDKEILSVDISSKLDGSSLKLDDGIVWVNSKYQLKGDYFTAENKNDDFFKEAVKRIKWKKIRVIEDKNGMCGIDIYNQMYCWGMMSFYRRNYPAGNTFMLPVFNTNLYSKDKDYLLAEGNDSYLTDMTKGDWAKWSGYGYGFFMKYPTYIGGFNYNFIMK